MIDVPLQAEIAKLDQSKSNTRTLTLKFENKTLTFQIGASVVAASKAEVFSDLMKPLNAYWQQLPYDSQRDIFRIYQEVQHAFDTLFQGSEIADFLTVKVRELLAYHDIEILMHWVRFSNIKIPAGIQTEYKPTDRNSTSVETTPEKTYVRHEYIGLIALTLAFKALIPIWGEYVKLARDTGSMHKENETFRLIIDTPLYESAPMQKLRNYIQSMIGADAMNEHNRLNGISPDMYPHWLLSKIAVRRLGSFDLMSDNNIVSEVYAVIRQGGQSNQSDDKRVKEKKIAGGDEGEGNGSANKISTLEAFRQKTNLTPSQLAAIEFEVAQYRNLVINVCKGINLDELDRVVYEARLNELPDITDMHRLFLKWIYGSAISPHALDYVDDPLALWRLCLAAEYMLQMKNHGGLSLLVSAQPVLVDGRHAVVTSVGGNMQIPEPLLQELDLVTPYHQRPHRTGALVEKNHAAQDIIVMTECIRSCNWRATASESALLRITGDTSRRLRVQQDIRIQLARLKLELDRGDWEQ